MASSNDNMRLSDLPADILNCIQKRLPLADYLRFSAVCTSFRSAARQISHLSFSDTHFPWLISVIPFESKRFAARAICLSPHPKIYSIPFSPLLKGYTLISSHHHYLFIEDQSKNFHQSLGISIVNPFDSWAQLGRLPSSSTLFPAESHLLIDLFSGGISKLAMNSTNTIAVGIYGRGLAYTRRMLPGESADRWIPLDDPLTVSDYTFQDVVAYKGELFYAVQQNSANIVALDFSSPTTAVRVMDKTLNLEPCRGRNHPNHGWPCYESARLVSSPSGLFLVRWRCLVKTGEAKRREIDVYRLMDDDKYAPNKWVQITSLDNLSFFLSFRSSMSLSPVDFPRLKTNCIYLPFDAMWNVRNGCGEIDDDFNHEDRNHHLIYDLGDGSWDQFYTDDDFCGLWVTPLLQQKKFLLS